MLCPECESKIKNLEKLTVDKGRRERVKIYIEEMVESSREVVEETAEVPAEVVEAEVVIAETEASPVVDGATNAGEAVIPSGEAVKSTIAEVEVSILFPLSKSSKLTFDFSSARCCALGGGFRRVSSSKWIISSRRCDERNRISPSSSFK